MKKNIFFILQKIFYNEKKNIFLFYKKYFTNIFTMWVAWECAMKRTRIK